MIPKKRLISGILSSLWFILRKLKTPLHSVSIPIGLTIHFRPIIAGYNASMESDLGKATRYFSKLKREQIKRERPNPHSEVRPYPWRLAPRGKSRSVAHPQRKPARMPDDLGSQIDIQIRPIEMARSRLLDIDDL